MKWQHLYNIIIVFMKFSEILCENVTFELCESAYDDVKIAIADRYSFEEHNVTTTDGYILTLHRLIKNQINSNESNSDNSKQQRKQPIIIHHGLANEAASYFLALSVNAVLPIYLADAGYDIWLANARGTYPSRHHIKYDYRTSKDFWNYSWHEIGVYDLPVAIDYILEVTEFKKLHYIGYSQGTAAFFVLATELPEYNDKMLSVHAIGPTVFMINVKNPYVPILINMLRASKNEVMENFKAAVPFSFCTDLKRVGYMCQLLPQVNFCKTLILQSFGSENLPLGKSNMDRITTMNFFRYHPQGASLKCVLHYLQLMISKKFQKFDHGKIKNLQYYGMPKPPEYNLTKITASTFLYYSKYDNLNSFPGNMKLAKTLRKETLRLNYVIPSRYKFNHLDLIYGKIATKLIFNRILNGIKKIEEENYSDSNSI